MFEQPCSVATFIVPDGGDRVYSGIGFFVPDRQAT
jgi:hypothetical protein